MAGMMDGKVVVVTGAGGGIGREVAIARAARQKFARNPSPNGARPKKSSKPRSTISAASTA